MSCKLDLKEKRKVKHQLRRYEKSLEEVCSNVSKCKAENGLTNFCELYKE